MTISICRSELDSIVQFYDVGTVTEIKPLKGGLINQTYYVKNNSDDEFVIQRLHKMFQKHLMRDMYNIAQHLLQNKEVCLELLQSDKGALCCEINGNLWRVYRYVKGESFSEECIREGIYKNVGVLLGSLHEKLNLFQYTPMHVLEGFHDKAYYIRKAEIIDREKYPPRLQDMLDDVLFGLGEVSELLMERRQIIHGDPRVENIIFTTQHNPFIFIDYDTFMLGSVYIDIGDCLRSLLALPSDMHPKKRVEDFLSGYNSISVGESISYTKAISALKYITLELCLRFIIDSVEKSYFSWDNTQYATQEAHNEARALEMWNFLNLLNKSL